MEMAPAEPPVEETPPVEEMAPAEPPVEPETAPEEAPAPQNP
jgi:hypothetical protein